MTPSTSAGRRHPGERALRTISRTRSIGSAWGRPRPSQSSSRSAADSSRASRALLAARASTSRPHRHFGLTPSPYAAAFLDQRRPRTTRPSAPRSVAPPPVASSADPARACHCILLTLGRHQQSDASVPSPHVRTASDRGAPRRGRTPRETQARQGLAARFRSSRPALLCTRSGSPPASRARRRRIAKRSSAAPTAGLVFSACGT